MNGLALLCNLFADGPVTLARLRGASLRTLAELERTPLARLAECLHASMPQAEAFVSEARKLRARLAEDSLVPAPSARPAPTRWPLAPDPVSDAPPRAAPAPATSRGTPNPADTPLRPGLLPGLDEPLCTRLHPQRVRTVGQLAEFAGLALARRTGIPYATLLELARHARRFGGDAARNPAGAASRPAPGADARAPRPAAPRPHAPPEADLAGSDAFTLPVVEPESSGPFG